MPDSPSLCNKDLPIPPDCWPHRAQMPQTMRIHHPPPRREIKQLQTHRQRDPRDNHARPRRPRLPSLPVPPDTICSPQDILHNTTHHIRRHVVRVIPAPQRKVGYMRRIQPYTYTRPDPQYGSASGIFGTVQVEDTDRRVVKPITHTRARRKIIQLLRHVKIPRMKHHTKHPTRQSKIPKQYVIFA